MSLLSFLVNVIEDPDNAHPSSSNDSNVQDETEAQQEEENAVTELIREKLANSKGPTFLDSVKHSKVRISAPQSTHIIHISEPISRPADETVSSTDLAIGDNATPVKPEEQLPSEAGNVLDLLLELDAQRSPESAHFASSGAAVASRPDAQHWSNLSVPAELMEREERIVQLLRDTDLDSK